MTFYFEWRPKEPKILINPFVLELFYVHSLKTLIADPKRPYRRIQYFGMKTQYVSRTDWFEAVLWFREAHRGETARHPFP